MPRRLLFSWFAAMHGSADHVLDKFTLALA
jgi:hypothetical protein